MSHPRSQPTPTDPTPGDSSSTEPIPVARGRTDPTVQLRQARSRHEREYLDGNGYGPRFKDVTAQDDQAWLHELDRPDTPGRRDLRRPRRGRLVPTLTVVALLLLAGFVVGPSVASALWAGRTEQPAGVGTSPAPTATDAAPTAGGPSEAAPSGAAPSDPGPSAATPSAAEPSDAGIPSEAGPGTGPSQAPATPVPPGAGPGGGPPGGPGQARPGGGPAKGGPGNRQPPQPPQ